MKDPAQLRQIIGSIETGVAMLGAAISGRVAEIRLSASFQIVDLFDALARSRATLAGGRPIFVARLFEG